MKIKTVTHSAIQFDNGSKITFGFEADYSGENYADFEQLEDLALDQDFKEPLLFEFVETHGFRGRTKFVKSSGFRFGNEGNMFFVPCYSAQNGFYTDQINIYYNKKRVCKGTCEIIDEDDAH